MARRSRSKTALEFGAYTWVTHPFCITMTTPTLPDNVHVITHPLVQHKLTLMRKKDASTNSFRRLLNELSSLMAYEVCRDMPLQDVQIETRWRP